MNKIKRLIGILLCALVLTGCEIKSEGQMTITEDGKVSSSVIMAYDKELISALINMQNNENFLESGVEEETPEVSVTDIRAYLDANILSGQDGVEISRYEANGYYGYLLTYEIDNIDDISTEEDVENYFFEDFDNDGSSTNEHRNYFKKDGDTYYANYTMESSEGSLSSSMSMIDLTVKYTVTLPTKPISHNADTVSADGKTLTWNFTGVEENKDGINYAFKLKETAPSVATASGLDTEIIMLIVGIVVIVIIIIIVLILFARNNKKLDKKLEVIDQTIPSAAPKSVVPVTETSEVPTTNTQTPSETQNAQKAPEPPVATETPVVPAPTVTEPTQVTSEVSIETEPKTTSPVQIETVPVVESIPLNNTQTKENDTKVEETRVVEEQNTITQTEPSNLDEMPIIMDMPITPEMQSAQTSVAQNVAQPLENIEQPVMPNNNAEVNPEPIKVENNINETISEPVVENNEVSTTNIEEPVTPVTPIVENITPVVEEVPVETQIQEPNIFDTPNNVDTQNQQVIPNMTIEVEPQEPIVEIPTTDTQVINETPVMEVPNNIEELPVVEPTINNTPANIEIVEVANDENTKVENTPIFEEQANAEVIETLQTEPVVEPVEEVKLEVLENNTSLEEPDIPLPEPVVEPKIEEPTLEEAPALEPTGNKFIRTDFIENNQGETSKDNNTNM